MKKAPTKKPATRQKPAPVKAPAKKKAAPAKARKPAKAAKGGKVAGGSITETVTTAKDGPRSTIPPGSTVVVSDAQFSVEVIDLLKKKFNPESIVKEFEALLTATVENKHGESAVDYRTRIAALEKILVYIVGKPLDRVQTVETTTWSYEEIEKLIQHSPALRKALRAMLEPFEGEDIAV